ncbi:MAG: TetR/AcrR family transcriptional regulator [Candidatus Hydrothermae bacterium]|nr:TetR/AcrR family transcriptional regulator [Candidatus Hydrothermae bacterium]
MRREPDARERILAAAYRLFRDRGYSVTPLSLILQEAGVSKGGFYHHFSSKEDLFLEIVRTELDTLEESLRRIPFDTPRTCLFARMRTFAEYLFARHGEIRMVPMQFRDFPDTLRKRMRALILPRMQKVLSLIAEPLVPTYGEERARRVAAMLLGAVRAPIFLFDRKALPEDFETFWKEIHRLLERGVELS